MFGQWTRSVSFAQTFSALLWTRASGELKPDFYTCFCKHRTVDKKLGVRHHVQKENMNTGIIKSETWQSVTGTRRDMGRRLEEDNVTIILLSLPITTLPLSQLVQPCSGTAT